MRRCITDNRSKPAARSGRGVATGPAPSPFTVAYRCLTDDGQPLSLMRHVRPGANRGGPPVLLVHGLAHNRRIWHLADRSLPDYLARQGFDPWVVELRGHGRSRALGSRTARSVSEYADQDLPALIERVLRVTGHERLLYVGHSLGGVLGLCQRPAQQARIARLATLGSPLRLGAGAPTLKTLGGILEGINRVTPLGLLPAATLYGGPVGRLNRLFDWWLDSPRNPFPMALWAPGSIDKPALREMLAHFDRTGHGVLRFIGRWAATQRAVDPVTGEDLAVRFRAFRPPLLLGVGSHDRIVPDAAAAGARQQVDSADLTVQ